MLASLLFSISDYKFEKQGASQLFSKNSPSFAAKSRSTCGLKKEKCTVSWRKQTIHRKLAKPVWKISGRRESIYSIRFAFTQNRLTFIGSRKDYSHRSSLMDRWYRDLQLITRSSKKYFPHISSLCYSWAQSAQRVRKKFGFFSEFVNFERMKFHKNRRRVINFLTPILCLRNSIKLSISEDRSKKSLSIPRDNDQKLKVRQIGRFEVFENVIFTCRLAD